ncbi:TPA: hypothetical protein DIV55_06555 [Patescibacteria group bacterium]|uniref:Uncharacterized protein n=1 Tax=Candidatus Gottesmanbacteria bacterium GW2011_GWA1_43_11 TaxID=1618436 RepID=A0A0G1CKZ6_9BACT|nr:MAG: hypothetical protein UV59_C0002G0044 [Candidatus Gottesmanbacteria bacterium GW2011_GWA1_43_11]HCS79365.1 hypothetical protein [Patescibacteria group bacterium]
MNRTTRHALLALLSFVLGGLILLAVSRIIQKEPIAPTAPKKEEAAEITLNIPEDYGWCSNEIKTDIVTTTGVGDMRLRGWFEVQFILDNNARQLYKRYDIDQTGDLYLELTYPPLNEWPSLENGTKELHVDISLEVYDGDVLIITLGPGQDLDVFCTANFPSPLSSVTPSASISATIIPSIIPSPSQSPTLLPTPRPTPGTGGNNLSSPASQTEISQSTSIVTSLPSPSSSPPSTPKAPVAGTTWPTVGVLAATVIFIIIGWVGFIK